MGRRLIADVDVVMLFPDQKCIVICCRGQHYEFGGSLRKIIYLSVFILFSSEYDRDVLKRYIIVL